MYTSLAARKAADGASTFRGLGHIDSHEDVLTISLRIGKPRGNELGKEIGLSPASKKHKSRGAPKRKAQPTTYDDVETLEVEIFQDKTALRSRKGDTGSVVWHAR